MSEEQVKYETGEKEEVILIKDDIETVIKTIFEFNDKGFLVRHEAFERPYMPKEVNELDEQDGRDFIEELYDMGAYDE